MNAKVKNHTANRIRTERVSDVLVIGIGNPPINAGSMAVHCGLHDAIYALQGDTDLHAAILISARRTFIAGSDLRKFGKLFEDAQLTNQDKEKLCGHHALDSAKIESTGQCQSSNLALRRQGRCKAITQACAVTVMRNPPEMTKLLKVFL